MHAMLQTSFFLIDLPLHLRKSKGFLKLTYRENSQKMDNLTLFGMGGGGIPFSLLYQILSADFFQKFQNFFGGES